MLSKFLQFLYGDYNNNLWIEVRRISPPSQRFFPIEDITGVEQDAEGDTNVFVGVVPRIRRGGKAADVNPYTYILWADLDKKSGSTFEHILTNSEFPVPNVIVDSGHGWHLYWRLNKPITTETAQQLMGDIAYVLGGDSVGDRARIMRLPNTINSKVGVVNVATRTIKFTCGPAHNPSDFYVGSSKGGRRNSRSSVVPRRMNGEKTRSEELFAIAIDGVLHGQSMGLIKQRMKDHPAGSKLAEMTPERRNEWIKNALKNAKKIISQGHKS